MLKSSASVPVSSSTCQSSAVISPNSPGMTLGFPSPRDPRSPSLSLRPSTSSPRARRQLDNSGAMSNSPLALATASEPLGHSSRQPSSDLAWSKQLQFPSGNTASPTTALRASRKQLSIGVEIPSEPSSPLSPQLSGAHQGQMSPAWSKGKTPFGILSGSSDASAVSPARGQGVWARARSCSTAGGPSTREGDSLLAESASGTPVFARRSVSQSGAPHSISPSAIEIPASRPLTPSRSGDLGRMLKSGIGFGTGSARSISSARPSRNPRASWSSSGKSISVPGSPTTLGQFHRQSQGGMSAALSVPSGQASANAVVSIADLLTENQIQEKLREMMAHQEASASLLTMFLNRCNSSWANGYGWGAPNMHTAAQDQDWARGDAAFAYKADFARKLRNGKVCQLAVCFLDGRQ